MARSRKTDVRIFAKRVVVLGGGFGGVRAALELDRLLPRDYAVVLVDKRAYHLPHWQLYETATAYLLREEKADFEKVQSLVGIPFREIFKGTRVQFVQATVKDLFLSDRSVALSFPRNDLFSDDLHTGLLHFSHLVLALGAETNYFGISGLSEKSYGLKDLDDSLNLRSGLEELFARKKKGDPIHIVVGGGGFTGVELAAELTGFLRKLAKKYALSYADVSVTIVEAGRTVLPGAAAWIVGKALGRLAALGIRTVFNSPIERFEKGLLFIKGKDPLPADFLVWTAGVRANRLLEHIVGAELTKTCMVVNEQLELDFYPHVYGIGDNVFCFNPTKGAPVPPTAQRAISQALVAAWNIAASVTRKKAKSYQPKEPSFIVPLGGKYALADLHGVRLEGTLAWCAKMGVGFVYLLSIVSIPRAISIMWQSLKLYTAND